MNLGIRHGTTFARAFGAIVVALAVSACGGLPGTAGPILANAPVSRPTPLPAASPTPALADPQPVSLPADDAPHHRLTEWWYYTGHLATADGHRYGFEFVIFRAERGPLPVTWASHVALTDETGGTFHYAQRSEIGSQVDRRRQAAEGFDFAITNPDFLHRTTLPAWSMQGTRGQDALVVELSPDEAKAAGLQGLTLRLTTDARKPAVLHNGNGWIDFGPAGGSYYYSRTSLAVSGDLTIDGRNATVTGEAWFDHQWGDFIAVGGGWDWFAMNLDDGTDITLSLVKSPSGDIAASYGTLVRPDGTSRHLAASDFAIAVTAHWTSPKTGAVYPSGWTVTLPGEGLSIDLTPTVANQELDTRPSTGVVYWEGSQRVTVRRGDRTGGGQAYVELTGYPPAR